MQPMRPKILIGRVVSYARAYARETHKGAVSVTIGCAAGSLAPISPDHAGSVPIATAPVRS